MEILTRDFMTGTPSPWPGSCWGAIWSGSGEGKKLAVRITETEAYIGRMDKACHAYQYKRTPRTETPLLQAGYLLHLLIYGMYHCLNFITEREGEPCGVLIRGAVPVDNKDSIAENRFGCKASQLTAYQKKHFLDGPENSVKVLALTRAENALPLDRPPLYVCRGPVPQEIHTGKRIGIDYARRPSTFLAVLVHTPADEEGEHGLF